MDAPSMHLQQHERGIHAVWPGTGDIGVIGACSRVCAAAHATSSRGPCDRQANGHRPIGGVASLNHGGGSRQRAWGLIGREDHQGRDHEGSGRRTRNPRQPRSLGSERGLATPSPDGKGEIPLGPSVKIMPVDSYSTLGRSCEPAFKWIIWTRGCAAASRARGWLVRAGRPRGELLVHLAGKLTRGPAGQVPGLVR
jgi:hypothetical protein